MTGYIKNREGFAALVARLETMDNSENSTLGFDMQTGFAVRQHSNHPCGTACCIGGHAAGLREETGEGTRYMGTITSLELLLGIPGHPATDICFPPDNHLGWKAEPRHAVALLKHYDETGEVDWDKAMRVSA